REPATASWDFEFLQYDATIAPNMQYLSFGVLNNVGIEAVKVTAVGDVPNFVNYQAQTFSDAANVIGYNWKNAQVQPAVVEDSTVYFVKTKDNNIWKLVFTKFTSGSTSNMNVFSKQNLTTLSVNELEKDVFVSVYPNPAANVATVVVDSKANTTVKVVSMTGQVVFETAASNGLTTTTIATENFTNGVYLVQVSNGAATSTQRLVVQH
ncbi:T9SS type A sorting domain-containing protein, partial [Fluviicola sp.]|uniref:T9SS type A sorting domain-containing protein n=1 Tax=Fluviicola sp. TaxID=1917219 RepID=UPI002618F159